MSEEEKPVESEVGLVSLVDFAGRPAAIHNFQGSKMEVWAKVSYATGPSCGKGEDVLDKPMGLVSWYLHEVPIAREDGHVVRAVRTVLVDATGKFWGFMSDGVYNSLRLMVAAIGQGPYDPPVEIVVRKQSGKGARRFYAIEPAPVRETKKGVSSK